MEIHKYHLNYYKALNKAGNIAKSTPFIEFMLENILQAIKNVPAKRIKTLLKMLSKNPKIKIKELAIQLDVSGKTIKRDIKELKNQNKLARKSSSKDGFWEVLK